MGKVRADDPAKLTDFKLLSFDVYSTLIQESDGLFTGLQPLLARLPVPNPYVNDQKYTLEAFQKFERSLQTSNPNLRYNELLPVAYKSFATSINLPAPSEKEANHFGAQIGSWSAFPDTVAALIALKKHYKLAILSNIDNDSIAATLSGPLKGVEFDAVYTAQNIGSYKPDLKNFNYLLEGVKRDIGVGKEEVLHTAQALLHDMMPVEKLGIHGAWINRNGDVDKLAELRQQVDFTWEFRTMGEMAEEVDRAFEVII